MLFQKCHSAPPYKYFAEYAETTFMKKQAANTSPHRFYPLLWQHAKERANVNLTLYEQQPREADTAIQNLLNAIQQGILGQVHKRPSEKTGDHDCL